MRSVHIQKDKTIFKLSELPAEAYATSMGLPGAPQIRLETKKGGKVKERGGKQDEVIVANQELVASSDESENEDVSDAVSDEDEDENPLSDIDDTEEEEEPASDDSGTSEKPLVSFCPHVQLTTAVICSCTNEI